jgi:hypothetical protein
MQEFDNLFHECSEAFKQSKTAKKVHQLAYGLLNCPGRHTISGMITSCGQQFVDWSSKYRLFQGSRVNIDSIFKVIRKTLISDELNTDDNIYSHMDDTILKKTGKKTYGSAWRRDPLGPPFHTNFIWGQRYIQLSISLPEQPGATISRSRAIPVELFHCPTLKKPKKTDDQQKWKEYKEQKKIFNLSIKGSERIKILRENIDNQGAKQRQLIMSVDGSYTNENVVKNLPDRTTLIGRIRKDTALHQIPEDKPEKSTGRKKIYGEKLPKPEEIRKSEQYPWQEVQAWAAGKIHRFNLKIIDNVRWRKAGNRNLKLVIIRPLAYRLTKKSRILYREPAYLICTDPELEIEKLLQAYIWRWEIEVNFREEKTLLGCGQAQVRTKDAVEKVPAFIAAVYSLLQLAAHRVRKQGNSNQLPKAKWYEDKKEYRETTGDIINAFRAQLLVNSMDINFYDFVKLQQNIKDRRNYVDPAISAHFYCRN